MDGLNLHNFESNIAVKFWENFGPILQEEIKKSSSAIQQMLEEDYPKLLKFYYDLTKKLKCEHFSFE